MSDHFSVGRPSPGQYADRDADVEPDYTDEDAEIMRTLTQGALVVLAHDLRSMAKLVEVRQKADAQGVYLPYFDLVYESGIVIRIEASVLRDEGQ